jgi:phospholipase C
LFDHTSLLRFLETRFGAEVPNLSAWRRATVGDMTTALNFKAPDTSIPSLRRKFGGHNAIRCAQYANDAYARNRDRTEAERVLLTKSGTVSD